MIITMKEKKRSIEIGRELLEHVESYDLRKTGRTCNALKSTFMGKM